MWCSPEQCGWNPPWQVGGRLGGRGYGPDPAFGPAWCHSSGPWAEWVWHPCSMLKRFTFYFVQEKQTLTQNWGDNCTCSNLFLFLCGGKSAQGNPGCICDPNKNGLLKNLSVWAWKCSRSRIYTDNRLTKHFHVLCSVFSRSPFSHLCKEYAMCSQGKKVFLPSFLLRYFTLI